MSRLRFKIYVIVGLLALSILSLTELVSLPFKSSTISAIHGFSVGILFGIFLQLALLAWKETAIIEEEKKED